MKILSCIVVIGACVVLSTSPAEANVPPEAVFKTTPQPNDDGIIGGSTVTFNQCQSSDADGDELKFRYDFDGDGSVDYFGHCRQTHTYAPGTYSAQVCVSDRQPDHEICVTWQVDTSVTPTPTTSRRRGVIYTYMGSWWDGENVWHQAYTEPDLRNNFSSRVRITALSSGGSVLGSTSTLDCNEESIREELIRRGRDATEWQIEIELILCSIADRHEERRSRRFPITLGASLSCLAYTGIVPDPIFGDFDCKYDRLFEDCLVNCPGAPGVVRLPVPAQGGCKPFVGYTRAWFKVRGVVICNPVGSSLDIVPCLCVDVSNLPDP